MASKLNYSIAAMQAQMNATTTAMVNDTSLAVAATSPPLSVEVLAPRYTVVVSDTRINAALDVA